MNNKDNKPMRENLNSEKFWSNAWVKHLETYLESPPRTGFFVKNYFDNSINSILEVAGGSCRDGEYLSRFNYQTIASDFDENTIAYLEQKFPTSLVKYRVENAFNLNFEANSFDLVFHNGFLVLFKDNDIILQLLEEQARVSKRYILIIVHNSRNTKLLQKFQKLSKQDLLYNIRFFDPTEIKEIIEKSSFSCNSIKVLKFGGVWDRFYKNKFKEIFPNPVPKKSREILIPKLYQSLSWKYVERIACIVELKK